jgi:hypothetical protein
MKRCAQCHGKLGLGVRFRNFGTAMGGITCDSVLLTAKHSTIRCVVGKRPQGAGTIFSLNAARKGSS